MTRRFSRNELWDLLCTSEAHQYANLANYRAALAQLYWETSPYLYTDETEPAR